MKIYNKDKNIILFKNEKYKNDPYFDYNSNFYDHSFWANLSELNNHLKTYLDSDSFIVRLRNYNLFGITGFYKFDSSNTLGILLIYKDKTELKAFVVDMGLTPQQITIFNKILKHFEIPIKKNKVIISYNDFIKKFCTPFELTLQDYDEEYQRDLSKQFINLLKNSTSS